MGIGLQKAGKCVIIKSYRQTVSSHKWSWIFQLQFKNKIISAAALTLLSVIAVMLTGCSDGRMLSDSELADVLSKSLGNTVTITGAPEGKREGTYSMKCADGTEFTVRRMQMQHRYFGPRYYDYLANWVHGHPELNTVIDEKGLSHEDFARGTKIIAHDFEELHTAIEAACKLVEDNSNQVPAVSDILEEYELRFERPVVLVCCLREPGKTTRIRIISDIFPGAIY
ncbi:MAG: hypothetical protein K5695_16340 [Oscillospiraceae bacterium]|nr:hypothetical protein [Oscillospiraceae bacterium]